MNFISAIFTSLLILFIHPLHVSVTEIEMDKKDKALEIMVRVFVDDLELLFQKKYNQPSLDILALKNGQTIDGMAKPYLQEHFKISLDEKRQVVKYLGHEIEDDAFIFYCEVSNVKKWQTILVQNTILFELHDDQSNLVHVTVNSGVKSLRLTAAKGSDKLTFQEK